MSITFELRGQTIASWPLTTLCIEQIGQIGSAGGERAAELLFGYKRTECGTIRHMRRLDLLDAAELLIPLAQKLPGGFEILFSAFSNGLPRDGARMMSASIAGKNHVFQCVDDYWTLQAGDEMLRGLPAQRRTEPAEVRTEDMGDVKITRQKPGSTEILRVLKSIKRYLKNDQSDELAVISG